MEWKVRPCCPPSHSAVQLERGASGDVYPNAQTRRCRRVIWISGSIWHWNGPTWLSQYKHCHRPSALNVTLFTITVTFGSPLRPVYSHLPLVTGQPRQSEPPSAALWDESPWRPLRPPRAQREARGLLMPILTTTVKTSFTLFAIQSPLYSVCVVDVTVDPPTASHLESHIIKNLWESYFNKFEYWRPAYPCDRLPCCFFIHETNNCMHTWIDSTLRWPIRAAQ